MFCLCVWIVICQLYFHGIAEYIILDESPLRFSTAFSECTDYNGTLISATQFKQHVNVIREQCNRTTGDYWIGDYSTLTPYLDLISCYKYTTSDTASQNFTILNNSIARCQARCPYVPGIAVKDNFCQCIDVNFLMNGNLTSLPHSDCDILTNGEILGGRQGAINVYIRIRAPASDGINPFCLYKDCNSATGVTVARCATNNTARTVCLDGSNNYTSLKNVSDWWTAIKTCIKGSYGYLVPFRYPKNNRKICGDDFKGKVWTTTRQYKSTIVVPDVGITDVLVPNIVCRTANLRSGLSSETGDCNAISKLHGYVCITYKEINISKPIFPNTSEGCIVDLTNLYHTTVLPTERPVGKETSSSDEPTFPLGAVLGSVLGGIVILLSILAVFIFRSRMKSDGNQNQNRQYESYPSQSQNRQHDNDRYETLENPSAVTLETPGNPSAYTYETLGNRSADTYEPLRNPIALTYENLVNSSTVSYETLKNPGTATYETLRNPITATHKPLESRV